MRIQVILDSSFPHPGSAPIWDGKKGEFRDWTRSIKEKTSHKAGSSAVTNLANIALEREEKKEELKEERKG